MKSSIKSSIGIFWLTVFKVKQSFIKSITLPLGILQLALKFLNFLFEFMNLLCFDNMLSSCYRLRITLSKQSCALSTQNGTNYSVLHPLVHKVPQQRGFFGFNEIHIFIRKLNVSDNGSKKVPKYCNTIKWSCKLQIVVKSVSLHH